MIRYNKKLIKICTDNNLTISLAESCTGGLITSSLISVSGASKVIDIGLITYSNNAKIKYLNIPSKIIVDYGAVSKKTAIYMTKGLLEKNNTDICIAVTGIAGPNGGTKKKPVGLVYNSFYFKIIKKQVIIKKRYTGSRYKIQKAASNFAILYTYKFLNSII